MRFTTSLVALTLLAVFTYTQKPVTTDFSYRMAFGSCFKHRGYGMGDSSIFKSVTETKPDSFVWLGDFAYLDELKFGGFQPNSLKVVKERLEESKNDKNYKLLTASKTEIIAIWDDHDFGINDGGKDFKGKNEVRKLFLDVMDVPKDSPRRTNPNGIYFSQFLDK